MDAIPCSQSVTHLPNLVTVEMLIRCRVRGTSVGETLAPSYSDALNWLARHAMIVERTSSGITEYTATERGIYWLDHIINTPIPVPVQTFTIPKPAANSPY
jgi:hypothetical protein